MIIHDEVGILSDLASVKKVMAYLDKIGPSRECYLSQRKTESAVSQFPARQGSLDGGSSTKTPSEVISRRVNPLTNVDGSWYDLEDLSSSAPKRKIACKKLVSLYQERFIPFRGLLNSPVSHVYHLSYCDGKGVRFAGFMLSDGDIILNANAKEKKDLKVVWILYYTTYSFRNIFLEQIIFGLNHSAIVVDCLYYNSKTSSLNAVSELADTQDWRHI